MLSKLKFDIDRLITYEVMVVFSVIGCYAAHLYAPQQKLHEILAFGLGYVSLILLAATLLIGPFNYLRKRRNPVNINLRRDVGIWAGVTGILHVVFALQIYAHGQILFYFFTQEGDNYIPNLSLFGLSNYIGAFATFILLLLMLTSNNFSLRWLKGKRWKFLQRFNYGLFALVIAHTFGYQLYSSREQIFVLAVFCSTMLVMIVQAIGVDVYRTRQKIAKIQSALPAAPKTAQLNPAIQLEQAKMARRRFLAIGGAAVFTGVASVVMFGNTLANQNTSDTTKQADVTDPQADTAVPNQATSNTNPTADSQTATPAPVSPNTAPAVARTQTSPATAAPATTTRPSRNTAPATAKSAPSNTIANDVKGVVLGSLASLPIGNAVQFSTPDTNASGFLVHEADGSVKAFSSICTHRPYDLVFNKNQQIFVCPLHQAYFDIKTGAATRGPTRTPLPKINVQVDGKGNVVYVQA